MKFSSEKERMKHPQAKLIPSTVWNERFYDELTDHQKELMSMPQDDLLAHLLTQRTQSDKTKLAGLLCCAYRDPFVMDADLFAMSNAINLNAYQKLFVAAMTGRTIFLNRSLGEKIDDLFDVIKAYIHTAFCVAARNGHLEVLNRLTELSSIPVRKIVEAGNFNGVRAAAVNGHLDVLNKLIELVPDKVQEMIASNSFEAFRGAVMNGHLDILNRLIELAPGRVQEIIAAKNFEVFLLSASSGHVDVLNRLIELAPERILAMIEADSFSAFWLAAASGHLNVLNRLIELIELMPRKVEEMIAANHFLAFRRAANNGHLDVLNRLIELAPGKVQEMIFSGSFSSSSFCAAAANGHLDVLNKLIELTPDNMLKMIEAGSFRAFSLAAKSGHLEVLNKLMELMPGKEQEMIAANDFDAFCLAAGNGHLDVLNKLLQLAPDKAREMIAANHIKAFVMAAENGHHNVLNKLIELAPGKVKEMVAACSVEVFRRVAENGHIDVLKKLIELVPGKVQEMVAFNSFEAFRIAAKKSHLDILNELMELMPGKVQEMIAASDFEAFRRIAQNGHQDVLNKFLTFPAVLNHAEMHVQEYGKYVRLFIKKKLRSLRRRQETGHSSIVVTQQEAVSCLIILRSLMREMLSVRILCRSLEQSLVGYMQLMSIALDNIDFLMAIPVVKGLLHAPIISDQPNELLREAMRLDHGGMIQRLLAIPEVMAQAERDNFYPEEARGQVNLRAMAQDRESSMNALSSQEQAMLKRLEKKYKPAINSQGLEKAFHGVYKAISNRYNTHPASFVQENGKAMPLPLKKSDYDAMAQRQDFSELDNKNALEAYYQHPTHTVFRYLSKPNPWMATDASLVEVNRDTGEQWSTFEGYKDLITLLWMAATDESEPATEGYTLDTRVDEWICEVALIGRAHNWDTTRVKTDKEGRPVLNPAGVPIQEEFDDLMGDKPSCYSGVKRRLFQSLKGHALFLDDVPALIRCTLQHRLREHMNSELERAGTSILEAVVIDYAKLTREKPSDLLTVLSKSWDVSDETLKKWKMELQTRYTPILGKKAMKQCIQTEVDNLFAQVPSMGYFLAMAERCQLAALCQKVCQARSNRLEDEIKKQSPEALFEYLRETDKVTGVIRLINAIHLGLLGNVGARLGEAAFSQLLCPDDATAAFYAGVLVDYVDDARLGSWLSNLSDVRRVSLIHAMCEITPEALALSAIERFSTFLRGLDENDPGVRSLCRSVFALKLTEGSARLEAILQTWLVEYRSSKVAPIIREKIQELQLAVFESPSDKLPIFSPSTSSAEVAASVQSQSSLITFEMLPNDLTGIIIERFERNENEGEVLRPMMLDIRTNLFGARNRGNESYDGDDEPSVFGNAPAS